MNSNLFLLFVLAICCGSSKASCSTWTERMKKYGDLVTCRYYVTSDSVYKDFIPYSILHHNEDGTGGTHVMKLRFFTLAQQSIKISLSERNDTTLRHPDNSTTSIISAILFNHQNTIIPESSVRYEIVIGAVIEKPYWKKDDPKTYVSKYIESFVQSAENRIRALATPDIVRTDEPNEVLIEIFNDGALKVTVNGIGALYANIENADRLKYISFASPKDGQREEFFYRC